jgi:hypothetical protein
MPHTPLKVGEARDKYEAGSKLCCLLHAGFVLGLFCNAEHGSGMFF